MDLFEQFKTSAMNGYNDAKIKGLADKDIIKHLDKFNKLKDYYTTSSCSGRIMLVKNIKGTNKTPKAFYFKSHSLVDLKDFTKAIEDYKDSEELWIKCESFILHIGCRDLGAAKKLLDYCQLKGLKRAGIITLNKRIIVEVIGTPSLSAPIIIDGKLAASEEYIKLLLDKSNTKLSETKELIFDFFNDSKSL